MDHAPRHADLALGTARRRAVAGVILVASLAVSLAALFVMTLVSAVVGGAVLVAEVAVGLLLRNWAAAHYLSRGSLFARAIAGAIALPAVFVLVFIGWQFLVT